MIKRFYIKTFGCQMNVNDSEKMRSILLHQGLTPVENERDADVVIVNSCAVREKAQQKIFSYIGRLDHEQPVVVAGCVAQSEKTAILKKNQRVDFVVGTHQFYQIDRVIDRLAAGDSREVMTALSRDWVETRPHVDARDSRVSAYISIMEGCNNFCSYCIVPHTRGREKNRPLESILTEAYELSEAGYQEIILLGQNVNNWHDPAAGLAFPGLLRQLALSVEVRWLRFITSYPGYFDARLVEVIADHPRIARHIHYPAQSGSTRILKKMNRRYSRSDYLKSLAAFRKRMPRMKFSSDFIVGFPGETEHDFQLTLSLLEKVRFESVFSFVYSPRIHTRASQMPDDVDAGIKKERLYRLQQAQERIQLEDNRQLIGSEQEVLVTAIHPRFPGERIARTESYRVVNFESATPAGRFTRVFIEDAGPHSLRGREVM